MKCVKPFGLFGCGQCMPCRINRRRLWTGRILLEASQHAYSTFLTLSYNEDSCPSELVPSDLALFWKRLRYELGFKIRYFAVGEYGEKTGRPHYHAIVFGMPFTAVKVCEKAWPLGFVFLGEVTPASAAYVTGYVSKKMTSYEDPRLEGRHPEFARMSLRPHGIGKLAASEIAVGLTASGGSKALAKLRDVPSEIRFGGRKYPLGRYLRNAMREAVGWEQGVPEIVRRQLAFEKSLESMEVMRLEEKKRFQSGLSAEFRNRLGDSKRRSL